MLSSKIIVSIIIALASFFFDWERCNVVQADETDTAFLVGIVVLPPPPNVTYSTTTTTQRQLVHINPKTVEPKPVALQSVVIKADVRAWAVGVTANLTYRNTLNQTIECQFVFPMADTAAVYQLEVVFGDGRKIKADVMERDEAEKIYGAAIDSGQRAVFLQNQEGSTDIYRLLLGNLAPNETATVTIGYAQPLDRDPDSSLLTLTLPVVLNPRFDRQAENLNASAIKSKFQLSVPFVAVSQVSYTMKFSATINLGIEGNIANITAGKPSDFLSVIYDSRRRAADVQLFGNFRQDHDFRLLITTKKSLKPAVYIEPGIAVEQADIAGGVAASRWLTYHIAAAWLYPSLDLINDNSESEYWFIIDRSGSMEGQKMEDAREALQLLIRSLPLASKFNIIGFGTTFDVLFPNGVAQHNERTMATAVRYAKSIMANHKGTEILKPLEYVYSQELNEGFQRFIILLTDGEVDNADEVIEKVRQNKATTRVFAIGIGEGASTALINGVTRVSNGMADYVQSASDRLQSKVIGLLKATTVPSAAGPVSLKWNVSGCQIVLTEPSSLSLAASQGRWIMQYAVIQPYQGSSIAASVEITGSKAPKPSSDYKTSFNVPATTNSNGDSMMLLHRLAAKSVLVTMIDEYKESGLERLKEEAIAVSIATSVLCEFTSLVAVDKETRRPVNDSQGKPIRVNVERPSLVANPDGGSSAAPSRTSTVRPWTAMTRPSQDINTDATTEYGYPTDYDGGTNTWRPFPPMMNSGNGIWGTNTNNGGITRGDPVGNVGPNFETPPQTSRLTSTSSIISQLSQQLIDLQNYDGSWSLSQRLIDCVVKVSASVTDTSSLKAAIRRAPSDVGVVLTRASDTVLATVTAVAILQRKFQDSHDEWQMIEDKAIQYLHYHLPGQDYDIDRLLHQFADALQLY